MIYRIHHLFYLLPILFVSVYTLAKTVDIHPKNFYTLEYQQKLHHPIGVNAGYLLDLKLSTTELEASVQKLRDSGVNTVRLCVDPTRQTNQTMQEQSDGTLSDLAVERLRQICALTEEYGMVTVISFFDLLGMAEHWDTHPYNQENGGRCKTPKEFFTNARQRAQSAARIKQIIAALSSHENVIWELARGINLDERNGFGDTEYRSSIMQWTLIQFSLVRRLDDNRRLIALSFLPNTLPYDFMGLADVDILFLSIRANEALRAVKSTAQMIQLAKQYRKPVFIGEVSWSEKSGQEEQYQQWMLWSSLASGSSVFLNEGDGVGNEPSGFELSMLKAFHFAQPIVDLSGRPRPPADREPEIFPEGSYELIHHITGYDWMFCIIKKTPGRGSAKIDFYTQQGWYNYQWFHVEETQRLPGTTRRNIRNKLQLQSPAFEQIIFGRLRYIPSEESGGKTEKTEKTEDVDTNP